jgi:calcineurin-like phosphoesterase
VKILIIGDVVGSPGRNIMKRALPLVFRKHDIDYCIANVENAAGGFGITPEIFREFQQLGVDCMTTGNHVWDKKEIIPAIDGSPSHPARQLPRAAGRGQLRGQGRTAGAGGRAQPLGRVFMNGAIDDPFERPGGTWSVRKEDRRHRGGHARGGHVRKTRGPLPRRRSRRWWARTRTCRPATIALSRGPYCTDLGMTGPTTVIGVEKDTIIARFTS